MLYDYYCPVNKRTVEVNHSIKEALSTWGEVCDRAGIDCGETPREVKVERLISGGSFSIIKGDQCWHSCDLPDCSGPSVGGSCCGGKCSHR